MNQTAFFNSNIDETAKISIIIHDSGNIIPDFTSLIDFTFGSNSKILADFLGSKPGFQAL
jgi:hypothetical protein